MGRTGVVVVDIRDRGNPIQIAVADTYGEANSLQVSNGFVYIADGAAGLQIVNVNVKGDVNNIYDR